MIVEFELIKNDVTLDTFSVCFDEWGDCVLYILLWKGHVIYVSTRWWKKIIKKMWTHTIGMVCCIKGCIEDCHEYDHVVSNYCFLHGQQEILRTCSRCNQKTRFRRWNAYCYGCMVPIKRQTILTFIQHTITHRNEVHLIK